MPEWEAPETGTFEALDVGGRGMLLNTRTGEAWVLVGADTATPRWRKVKAEVKESQSV